LPGDLATPRSGNSASHDRSTYGCNFNKSQTSAALKSARFGISTGAVSAIPEGQQSITVFFLHGKQKRRVRHKRQQAGALSIGKPLIQRWPPVCSSLGTPDLMLRSPGTCAPAGAPA